MIFSTSIFLFLFLPLFLVVYYLLPFKFRSPWILVASYAFYAWWRLDFLVLFAGTTLFSYLVGRYIGHQRKKAGNRARIALTLGIIGNIGVLAYFKYFNFGIESLNALLTSLGANALAAWQVILPIGISFYVFQATSYLVDVYRGDVSAQESFFDVAAFIALFPQLIAGPILRYKDVATQFKHRIHSFDSFAQGSLRFMIGFCKKVLIADSVAPLADAAFALGAPSFADAWLGVCAYAVQLFFDFSGYSDMAIGLGLMLGFRFKENFREPYLAASITDFWQRWHISLSNWLRDYLYIPLGGNRRGRRRTYINLGLVMLLGGLWHGAAWTFVLWGAWHGGLLAIERFLKERFAWNPAPKFIPIARTFVLVLLGWVTFRAADIGAALVMYGGMLGLNSAVLSPDFIWQIRTSSLTALCAAFIILFIWPLLRTRAANSYPQPAVSLKPINLAVVPLFLLGVLRISAEANSPFLYFQF